MPHNTIQPILETYRFYLLVGGRHVTVTRTILVDLGIAGMISAYTQVKRSHPQARVIKVEPIA